MEMIIVDYLEIIDRKGLSEEIEGLFKDAIIKNNRANVLHDPDVIKYKRLFAYYPNLKVYTLNGVSAYLLLKDFYLATANMKQYKEDILNYAEGFKNGYGSVYIKPSIGNIRTEVILSEIYDFKLPEPQKISEDGNLVDRTWFDYGQRVGRYYAAWCMVLENQSIFYPTKDKQVSKPKQTFESLFKDTSLAGKVKQILKDNGYIMDGKWRAETHKNSEPLAAYSALGNIIKIGNTTTQARIFYNEFGLSVGKDSLKEGDTITDRSIRYPIDDNNPMVQEFKRIFSSILKSK